MAWACSICQTHGSSKDCVASCRMCDYDLCKQCFESVCREQGVPTQMPGACPWLVKPESPRRGSLKGSLTRRKTHGLVKAWEQQRSSVVTPDPNPFSSPEWVGPTWEAFLWLPKSMVPDDLEVPLRRWICQWQEQTAQYNCHLSPGANVAGPAVRKARRANFVLWGFYVVNPIITWYSSQCQSHMGGVVAHQAVWLPVVFVPVLAVTLRLEQECLKYVLAVPHLISIQRIKVMGISTSYKTWRVFTLAMSILAQVDIFITGSIVATTVKASWTCQDYVVEETWQRAMHGSFLFRGFDDIGFSHLVILSYLAVLCQVFVSFAFAQPLQSDASLDYRVRESNPVLFKTLIVKKMSYYGSLQYFAECSRMFSVTCNDFAYDTSLVMREIRRIHSIMSTHEDRFGTDALVPPDMQNFLGRCITWAAWRNSIALRKKIVFFFLVFVMEKMFQLHLKITFMGIEKHVERIHGRDNVNNMLALSTAASMVLSLFSAFTFVSKALTTYRIYRVFWATINQYDIPVHEKYYLHYVGGYIHLGNQLSVLRRLVAGIFASVVIGLSLLAWAAAKLVMLPICDEGLWTIYEGCVTFNASATL